MARISRKEVHGTQHGGWVQEEGSPLLHEALKLREYTVFESLRMTLVITHIMNTSS